VPSFVPTTKPYRLPLNDRRQSRKAC